MLRIFVLILFVFQTEASVAETASNFKAAFTAIEAQNWDKAFEIAKPDGQLAENIVMWHYLRAGAGNHLQAARFLHRQSDWPGIKLLRKKSEAAFAQASPADCVAFFKTTEPQTGRGALIYAKALSRLGQEKFAQTVIINAWRSLRMSTAEELDFMAGYKSLLTPHHEARLEQALWQGWRGNAKSMLAYLPKATQSLGKARLGLMTDARGVDALIAAVPKHLKNHPGLAYARFSWRLRKDLQDRATALLLAHSKSKSTLGKPKHWAKQRQDLVRANLRAKKYRRAYSIASTHHLTSGSRFALSNGWPDILHYVTWDNLRLRFSISLI